MADMKVCDMLLHMVADKVAGMVADMGAGMVANKVAGMVADMAADKKKTDLHQLGKLQSFFLS